MGNAAITIHHPTSLDHGIPYLESGKIANTTTSMIRLEKKDGAAVGCGGHVVFKSTIGDSDTYSELYCYVDYNGKNNGTLHWTRNDMGLKAAHRFAANSEMIIDITF